MNNNEKPVKFTDHAKERLKERGISQEDAIKTVRKGKSLRYHPEKKIFSYYSNVIVFDDSKKEICVITAYKLNKTLEQKIDRIPQPFEWIRKEDRDVFVNQAYFLLDYGMEEDEILEHLDALFKATCHEFGE